MKQILILISLFIFIGCQLNNKEHKAIEVFEKTMGKKCVEVLDKLIPIVENELMRNYQVNEPDQACIKFLEEVVTNDICGGVDLEILKDDLEIILKALEANNFRNEIWVINKSGSKVLLEFNLVGNYLNALKEASKFNEVANNYYNVRKIAGNMSYSVVANAILENNDVNNYFIKRIIVADFIYMNLICTNKYDLSIFDEKAFSSIEE